MEVNIYSQDGSVKGKIKLPKIFETSYRPRLIQRAVLSSESAKLQPKSTMYHAGRNYTAIYFGKRNHRNTLIKHSIARKPRLKNRRHLIEGNVAGIPGVVKGPQAHPPHSNKKIAERINKKEKQIAFYSALSALTNKELIKARGHIFSDVLTYPIVVESKLEDAVKTKEIIAFLKKLGVYADVEKSKNSKRVRAGIGKLRGRKYKRSKSILFVTDKDCAKLHKAARNLEGVDVVAARNLSVELLAPGGNAGRLTVFAEGALKELK